MSRGGAIKKPTWQRILSPQYIGTVVGIFLTALILLMIFGSRYPQLVDSLGLNWLVNAQQGVYADCSRPENANISYCRPKASQGSKTWDELSHSNSKPVPFSLSR